MYFQHRRPQIPVKQLWLDFWCSSSSLGGILSIINEHSQITTCNVFNRNNLPQVRIVCLLCMKSSFEILTKLSPNYSKRNLLCTFKYCAFLFKQCKHNNTTNNQIKTGYGNTSFLECPMKMRENKTDTSSGGFQFTLAVVKILLYSKWTYNTIYYLGALLVNWIVWDLWFSTIYPFHVNQRSQCLCLHRANLL